MPHSLLAYLSSQIVAPGSLAKEASPGGNRMNIHGHCVWKERGGSQPAHLQVSKTFVRKFTFRVLLLL